MSCTAFLSLWISNGAVTGMMIPIIDAIMLEIIKGHRNHRKSDKNVIHMHNIESGTGSTTGGSGALKNEAVKLTADSLDAEELSLCKMMYLAAAYASSIGGIGTLTGTPPNVIIYGMIEQ